METALLHEFARIFTNSDWKILLPWKISGHQFVAPRFATCPPKPWRRRKRTTLMGKLTSGGLGKAIEVIIRVKVFAVFPGRLLESRFSPRYLISPHPVAFLVVRQGTARVRRIECNTTVVFEIPTDRVEHEFAVARFAIAHWLAVARHVMRQVWKCSLGATRRELRDIPCARGGNAQERRRFRLRSRGVFDCGRI